MDSFIQTRLGQEMAQSIIHLANHLTKKRKQFCVYCREEEVHENLKTYLLLGKRFVSIFTLEGYSTIIFEEE